MDEIVESDESDDSLITSSNNKRKRMTISSDSE